MSHEVLQNGSHTSQQPPDSNNFITTLLALGKDIVVFRFIIEYSSLRDF
jgi:hypothetical protein